MHWYFPNDPIVVNSTLCGIVCYFYVLYRVMKMREGFFWWKLCFCVKLVLHPLGVLASWNKRPIVRPRKKREGGDSFRESMEKKDLYLCYNVVVSLKIDRIRLSKFFFMIWRTSWHVQSPDMISRDNQICLGRKKNGFKKVGTWHDFQILIC